MKIEKVFKENSEIKLENILKSISSKANTVFIA